jgi:hypothetical protein
MGDGIRQVLQRILGVLYRWRTSNGEGEITMVGDAKAISNNSAAHLHRTHPLSNRGHETVS